MLTVCLHLWLALRQDGSSVQSVYHEWKLGSEKANNARLDCVCEALQMQSMYKSNLCSYLSYRSDYTASVITRMRLFLADLAEHCT